MNISSLKQPTGPYGKAANITSADVSIVQSCASCMDESGAAGMDEDINAVSAENAAAHTQKRGCDANWLAHPWRMAVICWHEAARNEHFSGLFTLTYRKPA